MPIRGDRKSERRQGACWIQALFQLSQLGQPGAERRLQLLVMKGQMVMKLRQMHTRADRLKDLPYLLQPSKAAPLALGIPRSPGGGDPRFPLGSAMHERAGLRGNLLRCRPQLLTGQAAERMRTTLQQTCLLYTSDAADE